MKRILTSLLLILAYCPSKSYPKDYSIVITLNLSDCMNCNSKLYELSKLKDNFDMKLVLSEEYQEDSSQIIEQLYLNDFNTKIIWDDALFKSYAPSMQSSVTLESKYNLERSSITIHDVSRNYLNYLRRLNLATDTLLMNEGKVLRGVGKYQIKGQEFSLLNKLKNSVEVFDLSTEKRTLRYEVSDSILRKTFAYSGFDELDYDSVKADMKNERVPELHKIENYWYENDTLMMILNNYFFGIRQSDGEKILLGNRVWIKSVRGKVVEVAKIEPTLEIDKKSYGSSTDLFVSNGKIYSLVVPFINSADRYYLTELVKDKSGSYVLDIKKDRKIPEPYCSNENYTLLIGDKNYYILPLVPQILSFDDPKKGIVLKPFAPYSQMPSSALELKFYLYDFKISDDHIWVANQLVMPDRSIVQNFYRINRKTGTVIKSNFSLKGIKEDFTKFDPINPDFFYYKSPEGNLIRQKLFY